MTDAEIKQAMRAIAAVNGLTLSDERSERDFATFKSYLTAIDAIKKIELPVETEPLPIVNLKSVQRG